MNILRHENFSDFWNNNYPGSAPLGHLLLLDYPDQWFRIHSLPESKRYPESKDEWKILLYRQNKLITGLIGKAGTDFFLVTGRWVNSNPEITEIGKKYHEFPFFKKMNLSESGSINLNETYPDYYDFEEEGGIHYIPASAILTWNPRAFYELLAAIANDETRAVFLSLTQKIIVAPYDGGVDCFLENADRVDQYKEKYQNWLSWREDGL